MKRKKLSSEINREKANNVLDQFIKELERTGFTEKIKKHLNLAWQEKDIFNNAVTKLEGVSFIVGKFKFKELKYPETIYRYEGVMNDQKINLYVQPLHEIGVPYDKGFYGVIPSKIFRFKNDVEEIVEDLTEKEEVILEEIVELRSQETGEVVAKIKTKKVSNEIDQDLSESKKKVRKENKK